MSSQVFSLIKQLTSEVQMLHEKIGSMMQTNITLIQKHSDLEERIVVLEKSEKNQTEIIESLKSKLKIKSQPFRNGAAPYILRSLFSLVWKKRSHS